MLLGVLGLGLIGTFVELLLLAHDETLIQLTPLILIVVGSGVITWHAVAESRSSLLAMRVTMIALIAGGALGVVLHYRGSVEFQKELDPSIQGLTLFVTALQAKAPPALAPGSLTYMGLFGLVCTYLFSTRGGNT